MGCTPPYYPTFLFSLIFLFIFIQLYYTTSNTVWEASMEKSDIKIKY